MPDNKTVATVNEWMSFKKLITTNLLGSSMLKIISIKNLIFIYYTYAMLLLALLSRDTK